jgi:hypothetical protein
VIYGTINVTANTMWASADGCDPGTYGLGACEPISSATGEFTQTATFVGQGQGTLVVYYNSPAGVFNGSASLDIDGLGPGSPSKAGPVLLPFPSRSEFL